MCVRQPKKKKTLNQVLKKEEGNFNQQTIYIYIYILYKIEILLQPNLSVYVRETPPWRLESRPLPPTPHMHLYLWSDHYTKGMQ